MSEPKVGAKVKVDGEECVIISYDKDAVDGKPLWVKTPEGDKKKISLDQIGSEKESESEEEGGGEDEGEDKGQGEDQGGDGGPGLEDEGQDKTAGPEAEAESGGEGEDSSSEQS